jgi:hypothetical protein
MSTCVFSSSLSPAIGEKQIRTYSIFSERKQFVKGNYYRTMPRRRMVAGMAMIYHGSDPVTGGFG